MKMLIIDPRGAGISGDMFIGALLDLGADFGKVEGALNSIKGHIGDYKVEKQKLVKAGIKATKYNFASKRNEISYKEAKKAIEKADISKRSKNFALGCLKTLVKAESRVHGVKEADLKLHDASDSIADFTASGVCLEDLGLLNSKAISLPINTGKGFFKFHGKRQPLPSPAVTEILRGKPIFGDIDFELTTPTGASLLVNIANNFLEELPMVKVEKVGYGAGTKDLEVPNVLKVMVAEELKHNLMVEEISVLETNIDDVSGEFLGHALEKLMEEGAKDVAIVPCVMKKNRPGNIIEVICAKEDEERLARTIMEETGSLGIRVLPIAHRYVLKRRIVEREVNVEGREYKVRFKVAYDSSGKVIKTTPEFEDLKNISKKSGLSVVRVNEIITSQVKFES